MSTPEENIINEILSHYETDPILKGEREPAREKGFVSWQARGGLKAYASPPSPHTITTHGVRFVFGQQQIEQNAGFIPTVARGLAWDTGRFFRWSRSSDEYSGAFDELYQAVCSGRVVFEYPVDVPGYLKSAAEARVAYLKSTWDEAWIQDLILGYLQQITTGFSWWEKSWQPDAWLGGRLDLNYRWSHQVERWILDEREDQLVGVKAWDTQEIVPRAKLVHVAHRALPGDLEGNAAMRQLGLLIQLGQDLMRVFAVAATTHGVPRTYIEQDQNAQPDASSGARTVELVAAPDGSGAPVFLLRRGQKVNMTTPGSSFPPVENMLRYLGQRIRQKLAADGVLLGHETVGSFALADQKDTRAVQQARVWGGRFARMLSGLIPEALSYVFEAPEIMPGLYPVARFDLGTDDKRWEFSDLLGAVDKGILRPDDDEVVRLTREHFGMRQGEI